MSDLIDAVNRGSYDAVFQAISSGANLDEQDSSGSTALNHACAKLLPSIVAELVHAGADIDLPDNSGIAPIHEALRFPDFVFGSFDPQFDQRARIVSTLCDAGAKAETDSFVGTPLNIAINTRNIPAIRVLSDRRVRLICFTQRGNEPSPEESAVWLISNHLSWAFKEIVRYCRHGVFDCFGNDFREGGAYGLNLMTYAAEFNDIDAIETLYEITRNPDIPNMYGATPLMIAVASGNLAIADKLLMYGANKYAKDRDGYGVYEHARFRYQDSGSTDSIRWFERNIGR